MALADRFDGFLVDLDGVVWIGREPVPGAVEALRELWNAGKALVFVTNNPGKSASAYAARLRQLGVEVEETRVVTAGEATAKLAAEKIGSGGRALVIGAPAFHEAVAAAGLEPIDGSRPGADGSSRAAGTALGSDDDSVGESAAADAVIVSGHRGFDYGELLSATRALQAGAALFATSRDPTMPMPGGAWPGTGAVLAAVETASGATAEIGGKPERHLFELARERIGEAERVAMVGDRVSSDIEGGRRAGLATILVLSGATTSEEAAGASPQPDHVVESLADVLRRDA
jgi:phosphoglycolate/pyridoxal phosphate phosphatase family enzyme